MPSKAKPAKKTPTSRKPRETSRSGPNKAVAKPAKKTPASRQPRDASRSGPSKAVAKPAKKTPASREPRELAGGRAATVEASSSRTDPAVIAFLRDLEHPLKRELETVRQLILAVSPEVREGLKWNAPSFYTTEHFATFNLRTPDRIRLILHTGAKTKATAKTGVKVDDPAGLLEWLAKDRCLVTFNDAKDIQARGAALQGLLREWMKWV